MKKDHLKTFVSLRENLTAEKTRIEARLKALNAALDGLAPAKRAGRAPKRTMSASARAKIAAAQRARWAKVKAAKK